jgi:hypothetical protein
VIAVSMTALLASLTAEPTRQAADTRATLARVDATAPDAAGGP